jgi:hypothetical protein
MAAPIFAFNIDERSMAVMMIVGLSQLGRGIRRSAFGT